jgi:hypothetical protein
MPTTVPAGYAGPLAYKCFDLATGAYKGQVPLAGVTFGSNLLPGSPGQLSGTIDLASPAVQALGPLAATSPARTLMVVDYLGTVAWAGIIWPRSYDFDNVNRKLTVTAIEGWSYLQYRAQCTDYSSPPYSGLDYPGYQKMQIWDATDTDAYGVYDPVLIAWQVISDALTRVTFGNILGGVSVAANSYTTPAGYLASGTNTPAGDYLAASYPFASLQLVDTLVSQLAQNGLGVGFDYALDIAYSNTGVPVGTVNLSYPRRGRTYAQNGLVVNCGSAISYQPPEDGTQAANTIYEQGISGSLVVSQNFNPLDDGYPIIETIKSRANIQSANVLPVLTQLGLAGLAVQSYPVVTPSVVLDLFSGSLPLGSFIAGDDVRWIIPATDGAGNIFDPRFPSGLDDEWRITGWLATVADAGQSTLSVNLALPPAVEALGPAI